MRRNLSPPTGGLLVSRADYPIRPAKVNRDMIVSYCITMAFQLFPFSQRNKAKTWIPMLRFSQVGAGRRRQGSEACPDLAKAMSPFLRGLRPLNPLQEGKKNFSIALAAYTNFYILY